MCKRSPSPRDPPTALPSQQGRGRGRERREGGRASQKQEFTAQPEGWLPGGGSRQAPGPQSGGGDGFTRCRHIPAPKAVGLWVWQLITDRRGVCVWIGHGPAQRLGPTAPSGAQREPQLLLGADTQAQRLGSCTLHPSVIHPQRHTLHVPFPPPLRDSLRGVAPTTGGHGCLPAWELCSGLTSPHGALGGGGGRPQLAQVISDSDTGQRWAARAPRWCAETWPPHTRHAQF